MSFSVEHSIYYGFEAVTLRSEAAKVTVIPDLGAKVISLFHEPSQREWMWRPAGENSLFACPVGTPFEAGALGGWDECLPTIAPCLWKDRSLPDHGEVWTSRCELDRAALANGQIRTTLELQILPLCFTRNLSMRENRIQCDYVLQNLSTVPEPFIWAMHPLFSLRDGDKLVLSEILRASLPEEEWGDSLSFPQPDCRKAFAMVPVRAEAGVRNAMSGESLMLRWDGARNPVLGLWLTRGGWHSHHHLALEPTNAQDDRLSDAVARGDCGLLAPGETKEWSVEIELG